MNNLPIIALIGIAILVTSTIGFGATISTPTELNRIGGSDNIVVAAARGNVTALVWTEEVAADGVIEVDQITFTVGNEDTGDSHTFEICAVIEYSGASYSPAADAAPECKSTSSIAAWGEETDVTIDFALAVDVNEIVDISFSIEETGS
ncbi:MAG: hypothetical protein IIB02_01340 [Thaumarchaeota archaeon]|nr:hypothetical protein [Nitrososphaerota archaeon]